MVSVSYVTYGVILSSSMIVSSSSNCAVCSVQSEEGQEILLYFGLPTDSYDTMLYVGGNQSFQKSDAFFQVIVKLGYPWKGVCIFKIIPTPVRDWIYDRIALNRYRLFGKYDYCALPLPGNEARFLDAKR